MRGLGRKATVSHTTPAVNARIFIWRIRWGNSSITTMADLKSFRDERGSVDPPRSRTPEFLPNFIPPTRAQRRAVENRERKESPSLSLESFLCSTRSRLSCPLVVCCSADACGGHEIRPETGGRRKEAAPVWRGSPDPAKRLTAGLPNFAETCGRGVWLGQETGHNVGLFRPPV